MVQVQLQVLVSTIPTITIGTLPSSVVAVFCLDADQDSYLMKRGGLTLYPCKLIGNSPCLLNSVTVLQLLGQAQNF